MILFKKAGKYPAKTEIIMENMLHLEHETDQALTDVIKGRKHLKDKIGKVQVHLSKIRKTQKTIEHIKKTLEYLELLKNMRNLKDASEQTSNKLGSHTQQ